MSAPADAPFIWDGTEIRTVGELFNGATAAMNAGRAQEYFDAYAGTNAHAAENLGYVIGYADEATRRVLYDAYRLVHPIFGGVV